MQTLPDTEQRPGPTQTRPPCSPSVCLFSSSVRAFCSFFLSILFICPNVLFFSLTTPFLYTSVLLLRPNILILSPSIPFLYLIMLFLCLNIWFLYPSTPFSDPAFFPSFWAFCSLSDHSVPLFHNFFLCPLSNHGEYSCCNQSSALLCEVIVSHYLYVLSCISVSVEPAVVSGSASLTVTVPSNIPINIQYEIVCFVIITADYILSPLTEVGSSIVRI